MASAVKQAHFGFCLGVRGDARAPAARPEAARESVLLKNEQPTLPLIPGKVKRLLAGSRPIAEASSAITWAGLRVGDQVRRFRCAGATAQAAAPRTPAAGGK